MAQGFGEMLFTKKGIASRKRRDGSNPTPFPVYWRPERNASREWEIDTLGDKRIKLRPCERRWRNFERPEEQVEGKPKSLPWMYICDTFSFFQCSFLKATDPSPRLKVGTELVATPEQHEKMKLGKARREDATFEDTLDDYCPTECEVLARLLKQLNQGLVENGIKLPRAKFFGPGQAAQATMDLICKRDGVDFTRKTIETHVPFEFREAARHSYLGGWFEVFKHGLHEGSAYEYDINSAYPKIMTQLPCLLHGQYLHGNGNPYRAAQLRTHAKLGFGLAPGQCLCLVDARVTGVNSRIGAMLHRQPDGRVFRPRITEGWYWLHELEAAKRAGLIRTIDWHAWRAYVPCDCPMPLRSLADLYQKRLEVGRDTPSGIALKLMYNSCYGKMAQSVGQPKYANAVYASLITAGCRCMVLDAIASHPLRAKAVLMIATDGIYFTAPHPALPVSNRLGDWETKTLYNLMLFKPGTYWDDETREKARNDKWGDMKFKARGVKMEALGKEILKLDDMFAGMKPGDPWPSLPINIPFQVISPQLALARGKWGLCGAVSNTRTIAIDADPSSKRVADGPGWSAPYLMGKPVRSTPYDHAFGDETAGTLLLGSAYKRAMNVNLHPDGFLVHQLSEVFFGGRQDAGVI
jgi:hypothetical protein